MVIAVVGWVRGEGGLPATVIFVWVGVVIAVVGWVRGEGRLPATVIFVWLPAGQSNGALTPGSRR